MPTPRRGVPRYRAIADELRQRIESGAIPPGALLPPESALTAEFKASRGTIRQAIAALRDDGFVTTEHGRGTHALLREQGQEPPAGVEIREREIPADETLAAIFGVPVGTTLMERETVARGEQLPQSVTRSYALIASANAERSQ